MIDYKYDEDKTLTELKSYIDRTYKEHYSHNKFQATEFIIDGGHGEGFGRDSSRTFSRRGPKLAASSCHCTLLHPKRSAGLGYMLAQVGERFGVVG